MTKTEYLNKLSAELAGLPAEVIRDMQGAYELRFIEGATLGRSEAEIVASLEDPKLVAARLKANVNFQQFKQEKTPRSLARMFFSFIGLGFFNLFMLIPATVFASLLFASFMVSTAMMVGGSAVTAAGLAGVGEVTINHSRHGRHHSVFSHRDSNEIHINGTSIELEEDSFGDNDDKRVMRFFINKEDRSPSAWKGVALMMTGIMLLLINLVVGKYTLIGIKRYAIMNYNILKGA
ncbi:MAG: hypothetical protein RL748_2025 [Pseudomonadota bacterium]